MEVEMTRLDKDLISFVEISLDDTFEKEYLNYSEYYLHRRRKKIIVYDFLHFLLSYVNLKM